MRFPTVSSRSVIVSRTSPVSLYVWYVDVTPTFDFWRGGIRDDRCGNSQLCARSSLLRGDRSKILALWFNTTLTKKFPLVFFSEVKTRSLSYSLNVLPLLDRTQLEMQQLNALLVAPVCDLLPTRQVQVPPGLPLLFGRLGEQVW